MSESSQSGLGKTIGSILGLVKKSKSSKGQANRTPKVAILGLKLPGFLDENLNDRSKDGRRFDTPPIMQGVLNAGLDCEPVDIAEADFDKASEILADYDAVIVRINPGDFTRTEAGAKPLEDQLRKLKQNGVQIWTEPDVQSRFGSKTMLYEFRDGAFGVANTYLYKNADELKAGMAASLADSGRVLKQNRGSSGEGIWLMKRVDEASTDPIADDTKIEVLELNGNKRVVVEFGPFVNFCDVGDAALHAEIGSVSKGGYFAAGDVLVDQPFLPRIVEGEVRMMMAGDEPVLIVAKVPREGNLSAVSHMAEYTEFTPDEPRFAELARRFRDEALPRLLSILEIDMNGLPILWTADLIPIDDEEGGPGYVVGEFNCSCVGLSPFNGALGPEKTQADVPADNMERGMRITNVVGKKAYERLT